MSAAGALAGAASRTVVSPLERLKIILQGAYRVGRSARPSSCFDSPGSPASPCPRRSARSVGTVQWSVAGTQEDVARRGIQGCVSRSSLVPPSLRTAAHLHALTGPFAMTGYMRGNGINVLRIAPYSAVQVRAQVSHAEWPCEAYGTHRIRVPQFSSYELFKGTLKSEDDSIDTPRRLLAGSLAGICSVVSTYRESPLARSLVTFPARSRACGPCRVCSPRYSPTLLSQLLTWCARGYRSSQRRSGCEKGGQTGRARGLCG